MHVTTSVVAPRAFALLPSSPSSPFVLQPPQSTEIEVQLGDEEDDALNDSFSPSSAKRSMFGRGKLLRKVNQGATMRASGEGASD